MHGLNGQEIAMTLTMAAAKIAPFFSPHLVIRAICWCIHGPRTSIRR